MKASAIINEEQHINLSSKIRLFRKRRKSTPLNVSFKPSANIVNALLTPEAVEEIAWGSIPNLKRICYDLIKTFIGKKGTCTAMQFAPVLRKLNQLNPEEIIRFLKNPKTNHVLVHNKRMKVVLIHWPAGKFSNIHGHAEGGCIFKVLKGNLEERRYNPKNHEELSWVSYYQKGNMAYIDDNIAHHAVGNPFETSAISIHVYTPGKG